MEKEFYQEMKQSLHEHRAEIIKTFVANHESFQQIIESVDPKDFGDIASEDTDRKMLESMNEKDSKRMHQVHKKNTGRPAAGDPLCIDVYRLSI